VTAIASKRQWSAFTFAAGRAESEAGVHNWCGASPATHFPNRTARFDRIVEDFSRRLG
jgi:hypothetical protein